MRGNAVQRLRRSLARAVRRAIAGSMALAAFAIGVAVFATVALDSGEAGSLDRAATDAASVTSTLTDLEAAQPAAVGAGATDGSGATPRVAAAAESVEAPPLTAAPATEGQRRSGVAAVTQAPGPSLLPLSIEERRAAAVDRAAARGDEPVVVEPPTLATLPTPEATPPPILAAAPVETPSPVEVPVPALVAGDAIGATISFYYCEQGDTADGGDGGGFCGAMRDGTIVYEGAAACAYDYLGQQFRIVGDPTGRVYTCHDTGSAVHGLHRDIFFHEAADGWPWLAEVGTYVTLEIVG